MKFVFSIVLKVCIGIFSIGLISFLAHKMHTTIKIKSRQSPCYSDTLPSTPTNINLYTNVETKEPIPPGDLHSCTLPVLDCPPGASCFGGYVRSCNDPDLLLVDPSHTKCALSVAGEDLQKLTIASLSRLSVDYSCNCWGLFKFTSSHCKISSDAIKSSENGGHPMFKVSRGSVCCVSHK